MVRVLPIFGHGLINLADMMFHTVTRSISSRSVAPALLWLHILLGGCSLIRTCEITLLIEFVFCRLVVLILIYINVLVGDSTITEELHYTALIFTTARHRYMYIAHWPA